MSTTSEPTAAPSAPAPPPRRLPVVALVLGLVLVAAVVAVGLLVERATDDELELPDRLDGGFHATDTGEGFDVDADTAANLADREGERDELLSDALSEVLDADARVRSYADADLEEHATLTVVDAEAGPVNPGGAIVGDPEWLGLERAPTELVREDDAVCQVSWGETVPDGEDVPDDAPLSVTCQLGADGRTYWLTAQQMEVSEVVDVLEDVAL